MTRSTCKIFVANTTQAFDKNEIVPCGVSDANQELDRVVVRVCRPSLRSRLQVRGNLDEYFVQSGRFTCNIDMKQ